MLRQEVCHREAYKLQNYYTDGACYQLPRPAVQAYKVGYYTRAGHTMSPEPGSHTTCLKLLHTSLLLFYALDLCREGH